MRCFPFLDVIGLPVLLLAASPAWAGPITYNIDDHPALQNGFSVSGTITTDGIIGALQRADITAWSFQIRDGMGTTVATSSGSSLRFLFNVAGHYEATPTAITFHVPALLDKALDIFPLAEQGIPGILNWYHEPGMPPEYLGSPYGDTTLWVAFLPPGTDFEIAAAQSVPEPGTLTLVLVGIGGLAGYHLARRRRTGASRPTE